MHLDHHIVAFKRYALYEKQINSRTTTDIITAIKKLSTHIHVNSIDKISTDLIRDYLYTQKEERCWAPRTLRNQRQYIKIFFNYCVDQGYIKINPVDKIKRPKLPRNLPRFLTSKQIHSILIQSELYPWRYELERYRNKTIIYTFLFTGIRLNELVHLKRQDIDMDNHEITVIKGKGRKERMIPIHADLYPVLKNYLDYLDRQKQESIWLFHNLRNTTQLKGRTVQSFCNKLSTKSGVKFTPHQLRHTFGRNCTNAEINIFKIKELMGHSDISTTQIYLSVAKEALKQSFSTVALI